ncbi:hypothetical protein DL766_000811 [Monosporascus sp. MC13-8B]|uniref:Uncharacterized protein n=1 Tax=Monosporascus cannonballus TaxID=155416 RepID=A0ABY0HHD0_9PEZI|nr:hypothetical protein DL762_001120 [Monosporascus cannonballus]RYO98397.1 hypothetical protein DL763_002236 [Monosporascus cannonballus]RYP38811.1 hypothetical protein DL766_000811 [Monosporascus sp. MC13-8B]
METYIAEVFQLLRNLRKLQQMPALVFAGHRTSNTYSEGVDNPVLFAALERVEMPTGSMGASIISAGHDQIMHCGPDLQELFAQGLKLAESPSLKKKEKGQQQQLQKQKLRVSKMALTDLLTSSSFTISPSGFCFMDRGLHPNHDIHVGVEITQAAWPQITTARGLIVDSAKTRWGQIKRKLGLNSTAKPLPEPANRIRKAAAGKGKGAAKSSLAAKRAAVGAAEGLGSLQDDTDRSEDEAGEAEYQYRIKKPDGSRTWRYD